MSDPTADRLLALDGNALIAAERHRQVVAEGYTPEHDDAHGWQVLHQAAMTYCGEEGYEWPWSPQTFKPTNVVRNTIKAGALAQAAVEVAERAGVPRPVPAAAVRVHCVRALDEMFSGVRALLAQSSEGTEAAVERCAGCGHAPHDRMGFCPNMASDNDCSCPGSSGGTEGGASS